jgi:signal transduction histidine kinase
VEHAFDAFQRGPEGTGRKASGLGLGLFIAREIVRRHGGDIGVDSRAGETRVEVRLPRGDPGDAAERPREGRSTGS